MSTLFGKRSTALSCAHSSQRIEPLVQYYGLSVELQLLEFKGGEYNLLLISPPFPCSSDMIREMDLGRYGTCPSRTQHSTFLTGVDISAVYFFFCMLGLCFTLRVFAEHVLHGLGHRTCWSSLVSVPGWTPEALPRCSSSGRLSLLPWCRRGARSSSSSSLGSDIDFSELLGDFQVFWNTISAILVTDLIAFTVKRPFQKSNW